MAEIGDEELLGMIRAGLLRLEGQSVLKWHGGWQRFKVLTPSAHDKTGRLRYKIHLGGYQRAELGYRYKGEHRERLIQAHRLIYMLTHGRAPNGHVDHVDHDRYNNDPENLAERDPSENSADNWSKSNLDAALAFFDDPEDYVG